MTTTINAVASTGLVQTSDGSGVIKVQSNGVTTNALAWVNFLGGSTPTVKSSYNVSSVTYVSTGIWNVTFATANTDSNYVVVVSNGGNSTSNIAANVATITSTSVAQILHYEAGSVSNLFTNQSIFVAIFGN